MDPSEMLDEMASPVLVAAAGLGGIIFIASVAGIYFDARRRVAKGEALVWALGNLMAQPLGLPLYLWRAYRHPDRIPTPGTVMPWVRAATFATASTWAMTLALIPMAAILFAVAQVDGAWGSSLCVLMGIQGVTFAPLMIAWTYLFRAVVDRRPATSLGTPLSAGLAFGANLLGLLAGVALVAAAAGAMWALGAVEPRSADLQAGLLSVLALCVPLYLSAFFEEIVLRGYVQRNLYLAWGHTPAVAGSALCFGLMHAMNPGIGWTAVANIVLVGVLLSLTVIRTNNLWVATGLHFGWNLTMGPVLGLPVSGVSLDSVFRLQPTGSAGWLAGGEFGPEASPLVAAVLLVGIAIACVAVSRGSRWHEPPDVEAERPIAAPSPEPTGVGDVAGYANRLTSLPPEE
ncbi:MAG: CPBP family intramembrane metalloprotease [candidate division WS1 bacterium]|nr:CPBP family intramembrane metalloprotease [candidate division WS1 bacterium]